MASLLARPWDPPLDAAEFSGQLGVLPAPPAPNLFHCLSDNRDLDSLMLYRTTTSLLLALLSTFAVLPASAQDLDRVEIEIEIDHNLANPHELDIWTEFNHADSTVIVRSFWDGGNIFLSRFTPPLAGEWTYTSRQSEDEVLETGSFTSTGNSNSPYVEKGRPRISDDGRHLSYGDGTPFFYLADTAWEISWKSTREQVTTYLDDRAAKGFTAIQFVPLSHQLLFPHGINNREGNPFFLAANFDRPNPEYFRYIDWLVDEINKRNMIAVLVPMWAYMTELYPETGPTERKLTTGQALKLAKYIGSRYSGDHVMWIVGGDNVYDTDERKSFWTEFAEELDRASGRQYLLTLHPHGFGASFDYFDNNTEWLDFHSYQSSHLAEADYPWEAAQRGYRFSPNKPVLNIEATYEDIFHNLWAPGDTQDAPTFRIRPEHVRLASYESVLSGALVGITYGANGVWQWNTEEFPGSHQPRVQVEEAWSFEGSSSMTVLRDIMESYGWSKFNPGFNIIDGSDPDDFIPSAYNDEYIVAYFPWSVRTIDLSIGDIATSISSHWINPITGDSLAGQRYDDLDQIQVQKPDEGDWIWVAEVLKSAVTQIPEATFLLKGALAPNPFSSSTSFRLTLEEEGRVSYTIWDVQGKQVQRDSQDFGSGTHQFEVKLDHRGVFVYEIVYEGPDGEMRYQGKMISM